MEVMYLKNKIDSNLSIYGDKIYLDGYDFCGISYDNNLRVKDLVKEDIDSIYYFNLFNIKNNIFNMYIKDLSLSYFKFFILYYAIINNKNKYTIVLDYFDKGLSYRNKKNLINYFKLNNIVNYLVISNDLVFLYNLSKNVIIYDNDKIIYDGEFIDLFKSNIKIDYPEIINFINLINGKYKISYTVDNKELAKDIYRSVK